MTVSIRPTTATWDYRARVKLIEEYEFDGMREGGAEIEAYGDSLHQKGLSHWQKQITSSGVFGIETVLSNRPLTSGRLGPYFLGYKCSKPENYAALAWTTLAIGLYYCGP